MYLSSSQRHIAKFVGSSQPTDSLVQAEAGISAFSLLLARDREASKVNALARGWCVWTKAAGALAIGAAPSRHVTTIWLDLRSATLIAVVGGFITTTEKFGTSTSTANCDGIGRGCT